MNKVEMSAEILIKELQSTAIFSCIPIDELSMISDFAKIFSYDDEEIIIKEGSINRGLFVLIDGKLEIIKMGKSGDVKVASLSKNSIFGETSLFKNESATATVKAVKYSTILLISKEQFLSYINTSPKAGNIILTYIIFSLLQKLNSTNQELVQEKSNEFSSEDLESIMSMFNNISDNVIDDEIKRKSWLDD